MELTAYGRQKMYQQIKERFGLKAAQRDKLDRLPGLDGILKLAFREEWRTIESLLKDQGII